ncbi:MAG: pyridoxal phosphate-dependent aminotransferase [Promethearchaeota archaeon]
MVFADRLKKIKPFIVMEILERAMELEEQGKNIIHFEIGEPDFDTPKTIIDGAIAELKSGQTHYTHSLGLLEAREAISIYKEKTRGTKFNPKKQIMITNGTSQGFFNIMATLINPGDEVIITDPGYPCYANFVEFFGGKSVFVPIYEEDKFDLQIDRLKDKITPKTKMIILNSPSNPTGQIISEETLDDLYELNLHSKNRFWFLSDEIYANLIYNRKIAPSLSEKKYKKIHDRLIVLDGFSKYWAMTGWRVGYIIAPESLISNMAAIQQNFSICAPSISQSAIKYAFREETENETKRMLSVFKKRRDYILDRIENKKYLSCVPPIGAFYIFLNAKKILDKLNIDSMQFSKNLLEHAQVAVTPGISFGLNGEGYIRISYSTNLDNIKEGFNRIEFYLSQILV